MLLLLLGSSVSFQMVNGDQRSHGAAGGHVEDEVHKGGKRQRGGVKHHCSAPGPCFMCLPLPLQSCSSNSYLTLWYRERGKQKSAQR